MRHLIVVILIFSISLFFSEEYAYSEQTAGYALIITIDGLRPDAILKADVPNLKTLIKLGSFTLTAKTVDPPKTLPSHTSLVTGLTPKRHGMYKNEWSPEMGYTEFDTIFTIAKKQGFSTAMFVGKDKLNFIAVPGSLDKLEVIKYSSCSVNEISESFISYMKTAMPQVTLIHFPEPDIPGHKEGWMSEQYLEAIKRVDKQIGMIISSLKQSGVYDKTFIVITADHGGKGKTHLSDHPHVTTIPWFGSGAGIRQNYVIKEKVFIYDTAPTVLHALGIKAFQNIEGEIIKEIFTE